MSSKGSLVGQSVALYLDGGWSISGTVVRADDVRVLVEKDSLLYMAYRDKISAICLNYKEEDVPNQNIEKKQPGPNDNSNYHNEYSEYSGLSLPTGLLTEEAQKEIRDDDFSVFFTRPEVKNR